MTMSLPTDEATSAAVRSAAPKAPPVAPLKANSPPTQPAPSEPTVDEAQRVYNEAVAALANLDAAKQRRAEAEQQIEREKQFLADAAKAKAAQEREAGRAEFRTLLAALTPSALQGDIDALIPGVFALYDQAIQVQEQLLSILSRREEARLRAMSLQRQDATLHSGERFSPTNRDLNDLNAPEVAMARIAVALREHVRAQGLRPDAGRLLRPAVAGYDPGSAYQTPPLRTEL